MDNHVGALISLTCEDDSIYQGKVVKVDPTNKNVTISSAFKNGVPVGSGKTVLVNGNEIKKLRVLKTAAEQNEIRQNTVTPKSPSITNTRVCSGRANESDSPRFFHVQADVKRAPRTNKPKTMRTRPKGNEVTPTDESDESSSNEGFSSCSNNQRNQPIRGKKNVNRAPPEDNHKGIPNVAPTPQFRAFEPQIPCPQQLPKQTFKQVRGKITRPCGIPHLDARNAYGRIQIGNNDLNRPIDFELLDTDFDFEGNFELFRNQVNEDIDDQHFQEIEQPKMSKNFAHYENIVNDPNRVTSWTNVQRAKQAAIAEAAKASTSTEQLSIDGEIYSASGFISTNCGGRVPYFSTESKKKLLRQAERFLGTDVFHAISADRIYQFTLDTIKKSSLGSTPIIVFGRKASPSQLVDRLLLHFSNRNLVVHVYGCEPSEQLPNVHFVEQVEKLPTNCKIAVCIDGDSSCDNIIDWLISNKECHIITVESMRTRISNEKQHRLYLMVPSTIITPTLVLGRTSFDVLAAAINGSNKSTNWANSVVTDIGVPNTWFSKDCRTALADCFFSKMLVYL